MRCLSLPSRAEFIEFGDPHPCFSQERDTHCWLQRFFYCTPFKRNPSRLFRAGRSFYQRWLICAVSCLLLRFLNKKSDFSLLCLCYRFLPWALGLKKRSSRYRPVFCCMTTYSLPELIFALCYYAGVSTRV